MGLFGKIFLLIIAQIIVIVVCVYVHIDKLMPIKEPTAVVESAQEVIEEKAVEEPTPTLEQLEQNQATSIQSHAKPLKETAPIATEEKAKEKEEVVSQTKVVKETVKASVKQAPKVEETVKKELSQKKPTITDEKVKALFDKKKETTVVPNSSADIDYEKIQNSINELVKANRIIFKRLSTEVAEESKVTVEKIATILKEQPTINVEIGGHTDAKGDKEVNEYISKHRALSVKKLLVSYGIDANRLSAVGYGESKPIVENDPQGYSILNRRVEFKVIKD